MKQSSSRAPISPSRARNCLLINQFATPGLGSLMGRRFMAGTGQLLLAVAGFLLVCGWFLRVIWRFYQLINDSQASSVMHYKTLGIGALLFLASWLWAWVTSIGLLREAKRNEAEGRLFAG